MNSSSPNPKTGAADPPPPPPGDDKKENIFPTPPPSDIAYSASRPSSTSSLEVMLTSPQFPDIFSDLPNGQGLQDSTLDVLPQNQAQLLEGQGIGLPDLNNSASFSPPQELQNLGGEMNQEVQPVNPGKFQISSLKKNGLQFKVTKGYKIIFSIKISLEINFLKKIIQPTQKIFSKIIIFLKKIPFHFRGPRNG